MQFKLQYLYFEHFIFTSPKFLLSFRNIYCAKHLDTEANKTDLVLNPNGVQNTSERKTTYDGYSKSLQLPELSVIPPESQHPFAYR